MELIENPIDLLLMYEKLKTKKYVSLNLNCLMNLNFNKFINNFLNARFSI